MEVTITETKMDETNWAAFIGLLCREMEREDQEESQEN